VDEFRIEEGGKVSMKELQELFTLSGYDLSKVQLNELFLEMDAGRKFSHRKFQHWLKLNYGFLTPAQPLIKITD